MMKFGIICEGITDFHVLKHIIQSFNEQAEFQPIQPCLDETHKKTSEGMFGGWELVSAYLQSDNCKRPLNPTFSNSLIPR